MPKPHLKGEENDLVTGRAFSVVLILLELLFLMDTQFIELIHYERLHNIR